MDWAILKKPSNRACSANGKTVVLQSAVEGSIPSLSTNKEVNDMWDPTQDDDTYLEDRLDAIDERLDGILNDVQSLRSQITHLNSVYATVYTTVNTISKRIGTIMANEQDLQTALTNEENNLATTTKTLQAELDALAAKAASNDPTNQVTVADVQRAQALADGLAKLANLQPDAPTPAPTPNPTP